jgi:hypothetical protein
MLREWIVAAAILALPTYALAQAVSGVQSDCVQCVSVQSSSVQSNSVQSNSVQSSSVQSGCVQCSGVQSGGISTGIWGGAANQLSTTTGADKPR